MSATYFDGLEDSGQGADAFAHLEDQRGLLDGLLCLLALASSVRQDHLFLCQVGICRIDQVLCKSTVTL